MKLIVWLGNPWTEYAQNRHNAGRIALNMLLANKEVTPFLLQKKFDAQIAQWLRGKRQCMFVKPMTFMNKSGDPVQKIMNFYKIDAENLLVLHDDLDLPENTIRLKFNGGHGGQNGVRDIIEKIATPRFWRIKIGIWRPSHPEHTPTDRVLGNYTPEQLHDLASHKQEIATRIDDFLKHTWGNKN
jgi:PTH1 family peptidyl-tRNA hydrolase